MKKSYTYKDESKKFFNRVYNKNHGNSEDLDNYILENSPIDKDFSILDLGCGDGRFLSKIRKKSSASTLTGIDISENMIDTANNRRITNCNFYVGDSESLIAKDCSIDIVFCLNSFHHYPNPKLVVKEIKRVLKPGGKMIIGEVYVLPLLREIINLTLPFGRTGDYKMYSKGTLDTLFTREDLKSMTFKVISPFLFVASYKK